MKILFVGSRAWDDEPSVWRILDEAAGNEPVHLVVGYETRGSDFFAARWAGERVRLRRTFIDVVRAGKSFGDNNTVRKSRRDEYMVSLGGYDVAVILHRATHNTSRRPLDVGLKAERAGIPVAMYDYDQTVKYMRFKRVRESQA